MAYRGNKTGTFQEISHLVGSGGDKCPDGSNPPCNVDASDIASVTNPDEFKVKPENVSALSTEFKSKDSGIITMEKTKKHIKTYDPSKEKGSRITTTEIDPNAEKVKPSKEEKRIERYAKKHNLGIYEKNPKQKKNHQYNPQRDARKAKFKQFFKFGENIKAKRHQAGEDRAGVCDKHGCSAYN